MFRLEFKVKNNSIGNPRLKHSSVPKLNLFSKTPVIKIES
jgi:hypothetical protein